MRSRLSYLFDACAAGVFYNEFEDFSALQVLLLVLSRVFVMVLYETVFVRVRMHHISYLMIYCVFHSGSCFLWVFY